ncbi:alternative splicing regulator-domain-containing protein, partial [Pilobolus umbonatus]
MWQEAKANDKRIKELMVDHKKRAERRRAYFESRLGDPQQLLRVIGSATKLYADAEQFYYHENTDNLMPWQGNPDIKIDRFDGRSLLDYVPGSSVSEETKEEREMSDELNFERYHDLIEAERLHVSEAQRLREVEEEWTKLLDRHQAKLAMLNTQQKSNSKRYGYDYGTHKIHSSDYEEDTEKESQLLKDVDILQYVDDLTDKDKKVLNEMSGKYGIKSYARLLRVAKKDRDDELRSLQKKQSEEKSKEGSNSRKTNRRKRRRRRDRDRDYERDHYDRYRRRHSPTYEPFHPSSESESSEEDDIQNSPVSNVVIEFGSTTSNESPIPDHTEVNKSTENVTHAPTVEKKLTPMEKLKLKMRAGLEKQSKKEKERDRDGRRE